MFIRVTDMEGNERLISVLQIVQVRALLDVRIIDLTSCDEVETSLPLAALDVMVQDASK